jgi:predicted transcriptional regulator of viral defense system
VPPAAPAPCGCAQALRSSVPQFLAGVERLARAIDALAHQPTAQGERLLTREDVAEVLGVSRCTIWRLMPRLRAAGLRAVAIPAASRKRQRDAKEQAPMVRFTASSLARLIQRAANGETELC